MSGPQRLVVDWIKCDGHGICAELLPEFVQLDDWGYPMVRGEAVPRGLEGLARRAVRACPTLALAMTDAETAAGAVRRRR